MPFLGSEFIKREQVSRGQGMNAGDGCFLGFSNSRTAVLVPMQVDMPRNLVPFGQIIIGLFVALVVMSTAMAVYAADTIEGGFLRVVKPIAAPEGFSEVCRQYGWACAVSDNTSVAEVDVLALAESVNARINTSTPQISDLSQYGTQERWALPTGRGGDCEDIALLKKRELIAQGVAANRLLMATALDQNREPHAVLVLRTRGGDLVLDNVRNQIRPWRDTGYSFLRMQDPDAPQNWNAVLAGGVFTQASL